MTTPIQDAPRSVIVELTPEDGARVRKAPPDTLVMVVESKEITATGKRSLAAGGRCSDLTGCSGQPHERREPRRIAVSFPG